MPIYRVNDKTVKQVKTQEFSNEKALQALFEANLDELLDVVFLATEYSTSFGGRIDTLGIDKTGCPVIIEYKHHANENVINQGLSYLKWLLDHKADFESLLRAKQVVDMKVDWSSPRVLCVAQNYSKYDLDTVDILPLKIELYRYRLYETGILHVDREIQPEVKVSIAGIVNKGKRERPLQVEYSYNDHLSYATSPIQELLLELRKRIMAFDEEVTEKVTKTYVRYWTSKAFATFYITKKKIRIYVYIEKQMNPPLPLKPWREDVPDDWWFEIDKMSQIDDAMSLITQSYERTL